MKKEDAKMKHKEKSRVGKKNKVHRYREMTKINMAEEKEEKVIKKREEIGWNNGISSNSSAKQRHKDQLC